MTETYEPLPDKYLILEARCACRYWPVLALTPIGKCGYCDTRAVPTGRTWKEHENGNLDD